MTKREYGEICRDRRLLLDLAYRRFPDAVDCALLGGFDWEDEKGRTAIFDLYYLEAAGYVEIVAEGRSFGIPPTPYTYLLTKRGIDLMEKPGEMDRVLPLPGREGWGGQSTEAVVQRFASALGELRWSAEFLPLPERERQVILYHVDALLSNPLLQFPKGRQTGGDEVKG